MRDQGNPYGLHRVIEPLGELPQAAKRLDASLPLYNDEVLIRVKRINVDSTSFRQLSEISQNDPHLVKKRILEIVRERGKLHNPITDSGGMLIGTVTEVGPEYGGPLKLKKGDSVATLVSLTLTPLFLEEISEVDLKTGQLQVQGHAILFETGIACPMPQDLPEKIALAVLDICGAPALVLRHVKRGDRVLFMGAGKSAKLSAAALRREWGSQVKIECLDVEAQALHDMREMGLADETHAGDATKPGGLDLLRKGEAYDVVVNVTNVPGTEMASVMAVRESGTVLFFGMGTSFSKVALGAEGIAKDAAFLIGSGYAKGHAELALSVVRENRALREWFERNYQKVR
jgi:L-erythro-3,5-diaminohexanoate dehydrogenase